MQPLLYLFTLEKSGVAQQTEHPIPAGALYFPTKWSIEAADGPVDPEEAAALRQNKKIKSDGLVLADEAVLSAMEKHTVGEYIPVNKRGGLGDYAVTPEQMKLLEQFVTKQVGAAVDRILDGKFSPELFYRGEEHSPCSYCEFGDVCQKDEAFRKEHYVKNVKAADFWKEIGGEEDG